MNKNKIYTLCTMMAISHCVLAQEINVGKQAFRNCAQLTSLPFSVNEVGSEAFSGCTALTEIRCDRNVPPQCPEDAFRGANVAHTRLVVPELWGARYAHTAPWSDFLNICTTYRQLVAVMRDGSRVGCLVEYAPQITVEGNYLVFAANDGTTYRWFGREVQYFTFGLTEDIITQVDNPGTTSGGSTLQCIIEGGLLRISGIESGTEVTIYNTAGMTIETQNAGNDGTAIFQLQSLPAGLCIVHSAGASVKIMNNPR